MPVVMQGVTATGAGATTTNVLTGQIYERAPAPCGVIFYVTGDASGEQRVTVTIGGRMLMEESPVSRQARVPIKPDDELVRGAAGRGDQIAVKVRNTGAGSNNLFWRIELFPRR